MSVTLQDELEHGQEPVVLRVEGTDCDNRYGRELQALPLLDSPTLGDPTKLKVNACTNWLVGP